MTMQASHRSDVPDVSEYVEGAKFIGGQGLGNRAPSHHASKTSVVSFIQSCPC